MKYIIMFSLFSLFFTPPELDAQMKSIYDFKVTDIDGGTIDFAQYKGKKILIVNTASECGYTPQYEGLQKLYETYKDHLVIVGFPANNFMYQEPDDNATIKAFCSSKFHVTFPMAAKIDVKGKKIHPLYVWLTQKKYNNLRDNAVKWNFQKYLFDEKGNLTEIFAPGVEPMSEEIVSAVKK